MNLAETIAAVRTAPLDPAVHEQLGDAYRSLGQHTHATACYRSGLTVGAAGAGIRLKLALSLISLGQVDATRKLLTRLNEAVSELTAVEEKNRTQLAELVDRLVPVPLNALEHNRYFRMRTLSEELRALADRDDFSVMDIGGGDGALSLFLSDADYYLVEPDTNGLSGLELPLGDNGFDIVCACHVFEHIPAEQRDGFLDQLCSRARQHVVLLNPFSLPGGRHEERLQLTLDLTGAAWAREHLECGLPELKTVRDYAARRGIGCRTEPNGTVATAFAMNHVTHYAQLAGRGQDIERINAYLNSLDPSLLTNPRFPAAWLVVLDLSGPDLPDQRN